MNDSDSDKTYGVHREFDSAHLGTGGLHGVQEHSAAKVSAEIDEMGTLFHDRTARLGLVPPNLRLDLGVRADVTRNSHHDWFASRFNDILHVLNDLEVSQHVTYGGDYVVFFEIVCQRDCVGNRSSRNGFLDELSGLGKGFVQLNFHICTRPRWRAVSVQGRGGRRMASVLTDHYRGKQADYR